MNTKRPYEDALQQQMDDLPLPGENQSWQQMEQLLDKDKKRTLPPFFRQYGLLCLLALWFATVMCFVLRRNEMRNKRFAEKQAAATIVATSNAEHFNNNNEATIETKLTKTADRNEAISEAKTKKGINTNNQPADQPTNASNEEKKELPIVKSKLTNKGAKVVLTPSGNGENVGLKQPEPVRKMVYLLTIAKRKKKGEKAIAKDVSSPLGNGLSQGSKKQTQTFSETGKRIAAAKTTKENTESKLIKSNMEVVSNGKNELKQKNVQNDKEALSALDKQGVVVADSTDLKASETTPLSVTKAINKDTGTISKSKTDASLIKSPKAKHGLHLSAGVGVQQQIPLGGQLIRGYGKSGNTNALADYIPSIYLRLEKQEKWFAQAEFSYGAPQPVSEFAYNRKSVLDNNFTAITTTTLRLKKAYYHQLPVSFNYYITPRWSVGAGGIYSLLQRAIFEKEISTKNSHNEQLAFSTQVFPIKGFTDTFLYRSKLHWLLQTTYQSGHFSFGIRYARDAQPYIKYTLPGGEMEERKNWSLEFFARFRLWQSRK